MNWVTKPFKEKNEKLKRHSNNMNLIPRIIDDENENRQQNKNINKLIDKFSSYKTETLSIEDRIEKNIKLAHVIDIFIEKDYLN